MASPRRRLDAILVERGLFADAGLAARAILAGEVYAAGERMTSPSAKVDAGAALEVRAGKRFVSRGGEKLEGAFEAFGFDATGLSCLDAGASTGGFTDCLLQHGAAHVAAVDVGYGQFAWKLREDPRVALFERTNIRTVDPQEIGAPFDLVVADISFAPLRSYAGMLAALAKPDGHLMLLVKPQFEVPRGEVGEGGVVRDASVHKEAISRALDAIAQAGLACEGMCVSPLPGPKGNIEFLMLCSAQGRPVPIDIDGLVRQGHDLVKE